jgi:vacuolar-type H+-ATPase subunit D/Vma8
MLPAYAIEAAIRRHFARTIPELVKQNLSRFSAQWEESVNSALQSVEMEAMRRLDELMATVQRLVGSGNKKRVPRLRADLERIEAARNSLVAETAG